MASAEKATQDTNATGRGSESIDLFCERGILSIVIAAVVYAVLAFGGVRTSDFGIVQFLTVAGLGLWLVRVWFKPRFRLLWPPVSWVAVAFTVYAVVRCATDNLHYPARHELTAILTFTSIFFLASNNLTRRDSATIAAMALVLLALSVSALAIYQYSTHSGRIWGLYKPEMYSGRASGTFVNPNHFAGFLELIIPLALAYMFMSRLSIIAKVLLAYSALMMIVALCMSLSRGGMFVCGVTLFAILVALLFQRDFWLKAVLSIALVAAVIVGGLTQLGSIERRFGKMFNDSGKIEDARFKIWDTAKQIYVKEPILGPGPGHFDYEFWAYAPKSLQEPAQYVHNDYLEALCDWGAVGLAILLGCCALLYYGAMQTWPFVRKQPNELGAAHTNKGAFVFGAAISLFAILLHSFTDFNLHIPSNALITVLIAGLLTAHWRFATERYWLNPRVAGKIAVSACVLGIGFYISTQALNDRRESDALACAKSIEDYSAAKQGALMDAWKIAPDDYQTAYEIGECLRLQSWTGDTGFQDQAKQAMDWYDRASAINPYDPFAPMRVGMCLDWLDKHDEAAKWFAKAEKLAPNNVDVLTYKAWHKMQIGDWKGANAILHYALSFAYSEVALGYLELTERRIYGQSLLKP